MSPEAVAADRIYRDLREKLTGAHFPPGSSLISPHIAELFGTSISPVRDALHRLVGERLVDPYPGGGFVVPAITVGRAANLYGWHAQIIGVILDGRPDLTSIERPGHLDGCGAVSNIDIAIATGRLFSSMASCSPNPEHGAALDLADARLGSLRMHEDSLAGRTEELHLLWETAVSGNSRAMRAAVARYRKRRVRRIETIVSSLITVAL